MTSQQMGLQYQRQTHRRLLIYRHRSRIDWSQQRHLVRFCLASRNDAGGDERFPIRSEGVYSGSIMAQAYTPGLKVTERTLLRRRRILPVHGEVLVKAGDRVAARDVVALTLLPGPITPVNVANLLSIPAGDLPGAMLVRQGDAISAGQLLARSKGIFGWLQKECPAPAAGRVEAISGVTGQVMLRGDPLPVQMRAFLSGTVVEVAASEGATIEAEGSLVQGIFGIGGEAFGPIRMACQRPEQNLTADSISKQMAGGVVVGGARVTAEALARGVEAGVSAIVTGGIDDQDLRDFLGYDLGVATTGSENAGLTLVITEGFGEIAMARRTFELLASRAGCESAVTGATQIRAGVLRPEVVIPWDGKAATGASPKPEVVAENGHALRAGVPVRIIRDPYFGIIGTALSLPEKPHVLGSGSKARVLEVQLPSGEKVVVPRANVELIEE
jgi:biotin carboxyl carrier protein